MHFRESQHHCQINTFLGIALPHAAIGNKADICLAQGVLICQSANQIQEGFVAQHANYNTHVKQYTHTEEMTQLD